MFTPTVVGLILHLIKDLCSSRDQVTLFTPVDFPGNYKTTTHLWNQINICTLNQQLLKYLRQPGEQGSQCGLCRPDSKSSESFVEAYTVCYALLSLLSACLKKQESPLVTCACLVMLTGWEPRPWLFVPSEQLEMAQIEKEGSESQAQALAVENPHQASR